MILGVSTYCRIKTEGVFKEKPGEPTHDGTTFVRVILGGERDADTCTLKKRLMYILDVLGVEELKRLILSSVNLADGARAFF